MLVATSIIMLVHLRCASLNLRSYHGARMFENWAHHWCLARSSEYIINIILEFIVNAQ